MDLSYIKVSYLIKHISTMDKKTKTITPKKNSKGAKAKSKTKSIEDRYKKLDHHEHILKRSHMYIGSIKKESTDMWIYNENAKGDEPQIVLKNIAYVPGLFKIYDEVLVNARDHSIRCKTCNTIKVYIDKETGKITVWNNGDGIEVVEHKEHKLMIPSLIFGELLSGENFDDDDVRTVGGMNGLGAKLANIFSNEFEVETIDGKRDLKFKQRFTNNMYDKEEPKIVPAKGKKSYTKISFTPDFEKFKIKGLTSDMIALFKKRVYDIAMTTSCKVYYNDTLITSNNFTKYVDLYFPEGSEHQKVLDLSNKNWKICAVFDPTDKIEHQNISFVNGIHTSRGGTHVNHVVDQVVKSLKGILEKTIKDTVIKPAIIKENLIFFVDSIIVNPEFDTQTKEMLKTKVAEFGSNYKLPEVFIKKLKKTGLIERIAANIQAKNTAQLSKLGKGRGAFNHPKLYNAHKAGTKESDLCSLYVTEGDSALGFVMSGANVVGRDYLGGFPLRGKVVNVTKKNAKMSSNEEIQALIRILGLEYKKDYKDLSGLRYGRLVILTDQDVDGSHIKGLIINFLNEYCPSLLKNHKGFVQCFNTPLLKITKGKGAKKQVLEFVTKNEFDEWKEQNNGGKGWSLPKYYKGLGTSQGSEAQDCFTNLDARLKNYYWQTIIKDSKVKVKKGDDVDSEGDSVEESVDESSNKKKSKKGGSKISKVPKVKESAEFIDEESDAVTEAYKPRCKDATEDAIQLAFGMGKERNDDRKIWVNSYDPKICIDTSKKDISIYEFIHKELVAYSYAAVQRAIPNIMDGFKPSQRKVYYGSIWENIYGEEREMKVAQLGSAVSKITHYHHGEASLYGTIVQMAQNFVGTNNINLLFPDGQFGTRLAGGDDAASERYIHTYLVDLGKKIFIPEDYDILPPEYDDGHKIEPKFYAPIIPMILVNGCDGIGTGYSTKIKPCNPRDIYANLKRIINGEKPKAMTPWYRHFTGTIEKIEPGKYVCRGKYELIDNDTIHITDLPIGTWTNNYKEFLYELLYGESANGKKKKGSTDTETKPKGKKTAKGKAGSKKNKRLQAAAKRSKTAKVAKTNNIGELIKSYTEDCTDIRVSFTIKFKPGKLKGLIKSGKLETGLKLATPLNLTNMHLFDEEGKIKKYKTYSAILQDFARVRLKLYQDRKDFLLDKWKREADILQWKIKFIEGVIKGEIVVFKNGRSKKRAEVIKRLVELGFPEFQVGSETKPSYNYITSILLFNLTEEEVEKLRKQLEDKEEEIAILEAKTPSQMWDEELDIFMDAYDKWETQIIEEYEARLKGKKGSKKPRRSPSKKNVKASDDDVIEI